MYIYNDYRVLKPMKRKENDEKKEQFKGSTY